MGQHLSCGARLAADDWILWSPSWISGTTPLRSTIRASVCGFDIRPDRLHEGGDVIWRQGLKRQRHLAGRRHPWRAGKEPGRSDLDEVSRHEDMTFRVKDARRHFAQRRCIAPPLNLLGSRVHRDLLLQRTSKEGGIGTNSGLHAPANGLTEPSGSRYPRR